MHYISNNSIKKRILKVDEDIDIEARTLQMPKRMLQMHYFNKYLEDIILNLTTHIDHHKGCHEEKNLERLEYVFEYYLDLLRQTEDDESSFCGKKNCYHSSKNVFERNGIFRITCISNIVFQLLSRFQLSIDNSVQCHEAEQCWEINKENKKCDDENITIENFFENLYWKLMLSVPLPCCQENIDATYLLHPRRIYDR